MHAHVSLAVLTTLLLGACGSAPNNTITPIEATQPAAAGTVATQPAAAVSVAGQSAAPAAPAAPAAAGAPAIATAPPVSMAAPMQPATPPATTVPTGGDPSWCGVKQTLDAQCTVCHNDQKSAGAPMSLLTYADLQAPGVSDPKRKVYELVQLRVHDRTMPPQGQLTDAQLSGIDAWVGGGALAGADVACGGQVPPTTEAAPVWPPKNCDAMYNIRAAPETAKNKVGPGEETHPQTMVQAPWTEEVQAIGWKSLNDNVKILHHWILYGPQGEFLFGWAPGKDYNQPLPEDVGVFLPQGMLQLDMHYNNIVGTSEEADASGVEVCVLKKANFKPKTATITMSLASTNINIAPRAVKQDVTGECTHMGAPIRLLSASPHAHTNAHHMKFTVEKADGTTIVMHDADFDFNEQTTYPLNPPLEIVQGDRLVTTCTFSNQTDQAITFGEDTGNEMCFNFAMYEPMGGLSCGGGAMRFPAF